ncbi:MAG: DUF4139 domain-containing protein, partial [Candidatus Methylomirabilales bacterium]
VAVSLLFLPNAALAAGAGSPLAVTQDQQRAVALTVYNGNLGLVKDLRELSLPPGVHAVQFMDVAAQINPTTVHLKSLTDPATLRILEQNYEYDLLNPHKLLDKYVGKVVKLVDHRIGTGEEILVDALLLSTNGGPIFQIDGQIHLQHHGRVILPALPADLIARPTLVWLLENGRNGRHRVEASYLTGGLTWRADYVLVLDPKEAGGDLTGWVTLDNRSGATYREATLKLVAGDIHRAPEASRLREVMAKAADAPTAEAARREFVEQGFFEYHLYTLQGRTTVKQNQTKQLNLLQATGIPLTKHLIYYGADQYYRNAYGVPISNQKVGVYLEVNNTKAHRLGLPIPKGVLRVYKADGEGSLQFVGEDTVPHTPKDERVKIKMGEAFDLVAERVQRDFRKLAPGLYEVEWEVALRNHKEEPVTVTVIEPVPGDWQVLAASHSAEKIEAHTLRFQVPVAKGGTAKLNYRVRIRY